MICPEIHHQFIQLALAVNRAQQGGLLQFEKNIFPIILGNIRYTLREGFETSQACLEGGVVNMFISQLLFNKCIHPVLFDPFQNGLGGTKCEAVGRQPGLRSVGAAS